MEIKGKSFLVTGGASGLGEATAKALCERGAKVTVLDVNEPLGEKLAADLNGAQFVKTDVTSAEEVAAAVDAAKSAFGGLDGAVNCAGVGAALKTVSKGIPHDLGIFKRVIEINLIGSFNVLRLAAAAICEKEPGTDGERGVVINTASIAAFDGQIGQVAYSASKGGIVGMTLPAARDLSRDGVRVVTIAPGLFDTPLLGMLPEEVRTHLAEQNPFPKRLGKPAEYAALACAIVENTMINGEVIRIDAALRMPPRS